MTSLPIPAQVGRGFRHDRRDNRMEELFAENVVIPGIKSDSDIPLVLSSDLKIVFTLYGEVGTISTVVKRLKDAGKIVFVNIDMVEGFSSKNAVIDYMAATKADGIISSKSAILRYAKSKGFYTIHRFFVVDSAAYHSIGKQLEISQADFINIVPGWPKIISWTVAEHKKPVIAAGNVCDKQSILDSLSAGAIAICSTNHSVWEL